MSNHMTKMYREAAALADLESAEMTDAEIERWAEVCNHDLARNALRHYIALRRAARSAPEAGKAVDETLTAMAGFLVFLKDMRFTGSWDLPTLNRAIEVGETIAEQQDALASSPAPTGAEPVAWMVLRKDNLHLPVLTSREDADKYQRFNPEETLQPLYAYPQPVAPTGKTAGLVERLNERAASYRLGGPSSEHTASMLDEAAAALTASEAEAADLRRKLEEAREALEVIAASDDIENALDPARNKRVAARTLSGASE